VSDLIDATGEPSGTDDSFRTMARQVQLSVITSVGYSAGSD